MAVVKNIAVQLDLDASRFNKAAARAISSTGGLRRTLVSLGGVAAGVTIAAISVSRLATIAVDVGRALNEVFQASTEHIRKLAEQAESTGQSIQKLSGGLLTDSDVKSVQALDFAIEEMKSAVLSLTGVLLKDAITAVTAYALAIKSMIDSMDASTINTVIDGLLTYSIILKTIRNELKDVAKEFERLAESNAALAKQTQKRDLFKNLKEGLTEDPNEDPTIKAARKGGLHSDQIKALQVIIDQQKAITAEKEKQEKAQKAAEQAAKEAAKAQAKAAKDAADKAAASAKRVQEETDERNKQLADRKKEAQDLIDSNKTTGEKFKDDLNEISQFLNEKLITPEQAAKAAANAFDKTQANQQPSGPKLAAATLAGTSDFLSKLQKINNPDDNPNKKIEKNTREQAEYAKKLYDYWARSVGVSI